MLDTPESPGPGVPQSPQMKNLGARAELAGGRPVAELCTLWVPGRNHNPRPGGVRLQNGRPILLGPIACPAP